MTDMIGRQVHQVVFGYSWIAKVIGVWKYGYVVEIDQRHKEQFEKLGLGKFEPSKVDKVKLLETIENMSDEQITILKRLIVPIKEEQLQNVGWEEFDNNYGQIVDEALEKSEIILEQLFSKEEER